MNKRLWSALALGVATLPSLAGAQAGPRSVASATASAEIVPTDLNLTPKYILAFGLVKGGSAPGTVTVKPEGIRTPGGAAEMVGSGPCQTVFCEDETHTSNTNSASYWGPGRFQVTGAPGSAYRVSVGSSALAYWRTPAQGRTPQLTVTNFTVRTNSQGSASGILDATGSDFINVGGTLQVPSGMKAASYRVEVPIHVEYN